jgi:hypothetical protein
MSLFSDARRCSTAVPILPSYRCKLRHHVTPPNPTPWQVIFLASTCAYFGKRSARGLRKLEPTGQAGATPNREEVLAHIEDQYLISGRAVV